MNNNRVIKPEIIQNLIFTIRGMQVMIDEDLAEIYGVELKRLNEQVKRNIDRFPEQFRFQLTKEEYETTRSQIKAIQYKSQVLRSQFATLEDKRGKHRKYLPYVFTEQGVSMLSAVLNSKTAVKVSIQIINAFVEMRRFIVANAGIFQRLNKVEQKQLEIDEKFKYIFNALEDKGRKPKQGVFYDGQIFDAYTFVVDLIKKSRKSILLIDNFVDDTVLTILSKREKGVSATIYTKSISKQLKLDLLKHNQQYPIIEIFKFQHAHDRFLIIDNTQLYHFGASLKDLGKKWFAFSKMDHELVNFISNLKKDNINE